MSGICPTQILKENVVYSIKALPLDAKDTVLSKVINDALRIPRRQK